MMYHAQSFAQHGFLTDLIGYGGSKPIPALERLATLRLHHLPELPTAVGGLPFILAAPIKVILQVISILAVLLILIRAPPEFILVQNPPSIPTLLLVQIVGKIRGSKVIIDWHNLGYSILALKLGERHFLVHVAKWFEKTFGRHAYAHLFVTQAMKDYLTKEWDLKGKKVVLYDRPPKHFHRASPSETHDLFLRLGSSLSIDKSPAPPESTLLTEMKPYSPSTSSPLAGASSLHETSLPSLRSDRPAVVVSSTSWTPDEDFSILLDALEMYEQHAQDRDAQHKESTSGLPKLLVIVTGKGPLRSTYMQRINELQKTWKWVRCVSLWLEAKDYPILLGSADLGVSLHSSSSALDLPMKVVDMFGCGLPVCALNFGCLHELVKDQINGLVFSDATQLADQLETLLKNFPSSEKLRSLANTLQGPHLKNNDSHKWVWTNWENNWDLVMKQLITNT
ncbi:hypothetical protein AGABI1DRAFT_51041 [Agaricus bisporus var. burnettii JB137-S8]|uniref:Chitobiosyldiphosphodolichol beta-mannosyltransferase n=1 Tax=Agaricus bisporus var. burnettii (strain JB137-S8 / ATCC MYA-4627 / FGSC 10392) TaxID=597362 RepID=K5Y6A4_AGABU|nr:uncharacterized protein AGABI1DRAFT_51041 [Agaricus bisporus var. burnettii JB137-S8]EKM83670.1 hypothetical protein AGABI1DRAFT_51041 [Agaricus bisporus var. burnettii JB137-S8]